jgi:hypothetical protein
MTNRGVDVVWLSRSVAPRASLMRFRPTALWSRASGRRSSRLNQRVECSAVTTSRAVIPVPPGATSPSLDSRRRALAAASEAARQGQARAALDDRSAQGGIKRRRGDREQERSPYAPGEVGTGRSGGRAARSDGRAARGARTPCHAGRLQEPLSRDDEPSTTDSPDPRAWLDRRLAEHEEARASVQPDRPPQAPFTARPGVCANWQAMRTYNRHRGVAQPG